MKKLVASIMFSLLIAVLVPSISFAQATNTATSTSSVESLKQCKAGKQLCGTKCIKATYTCNADGTYAKPVKSTKAAATPASPTPSAAETTGGATSATDSSETGGAPHCSKGKPCGHSCIAKDKVCHKQ